MHPAYNRCKLIIQIIWCSKSKPYKILSQTSSIMKSIISSHYTLGTHSIYSSFIIKRPISFLITYLCTFGNRCSHKNTVVISCSILNILDTWFIYKVFLIINIECNVVIKVNIYFDLLLNVDIILYKKFKLCLFVFRI